MNTLFKNTSIYTIGNILPQIAGFILLPLYTTYLPPAEFGIVQSMQVISTILLVFFTFAIDRSIYRLYFDYKNQEDKRNFLGTVFISVFIVSTIILIFLFIFSDTVESIYKSINFYPYFCYSILATYFSVLGILLKAQYQINEKAGSFTIISLAQFIMSTMFMLYFIIIKKQGAEGMLKGQMIGNGLLMILLLFFVPKIINFRFSFKILYDILLFSLPMIPALISAWVLNLSNRIFLERYFSMIEVGIFSLGVRIAGLIMIISSALRLAYNPIFYKIANSEDQGNAKTQLYIYNNIFTIIVFVLFFIVFFFAKEGMLLLFSKEYYDAYKIIQIIVTGLLFANITGLLNMSVYQEKKTIVIMIISIICAGINILLNFILVPTYSIYGAAIATSITYVIQFALVYMAARKYYFIPFNLKLLLPVLLTFVILIFIDYGINLNLVASILIKAVIIILILGSLLLIYRNKYKSILSS